jgi:putative phosphoserine phosphatase/1-acylglycerol-3-phosphate O-acyltransferase
MSLAERLATVDAAPSGARTAAIFDFDGTLIDGYSALSMMEARLRDGDIGPSEVMRLLDQAVKGALGRTDFNSFMRVGARAFAGRDVAELDEFGARLARTALGGALFPEAFALVAAHRRAGHTVVIASSALPFQVEALAKELEVDTVLCTRLAAHDGRLTGEVEGDILWGEGKLAAVRAVARRRRLALRESFAYSNGGEDLALLAAVGRPCAINPDGELTREAAARGWPIERFPGRGHPGPSATIRTVAAYSGLAASFGVGVGLGLLNGSRRTAVNLSTSIGSEVALSLAGVDIDVQGERHLWSHRPAVFIFNHQSWLDGLIVMKLLRGDITGVAKAEVANQPGIGQFARLANMTFVDRANTHNARAALAPAVARQRFG